jgi:hypothetical protein
MYVPVVFRMKIKKSKSSLSLLISGIICLNLLKNKIFKIKIGSLASQNIQVSFYIRSTGLWPNTWIHVSPSLAIMTIQYNLRSMLILRFFCENSPRIIAASGADPAVLKTGSQALVCQFHIDTEWGLRFVTLVLGRGGI